MSTPLSDLLSLDGRVAVVTGGASGIARATAARLAEAGAHVALVDHDADGVREVAAELSDAFGAASAHVADVRDRDACHAVAQSVVDAHGRLDAWCNIAGIYTPEPALDISVESWDATLATNLTGTFNGAQAAAAAMSRLDRPGVIVNTTSSTTERVPGGGFAHYIASKGGVEALTRALAAEWGPQGIRVLAVSPTMTHTAGLHAIEDQLEQAFGDEPYDAYAEPIPLRHLAQADDIARVVLLGVLDLAGIMTGSILFADAGDATV